MTTLLSTEDCKLLPRDWGHNFSFEMKICAFVDERCIVLEVLLLGVIWQARTNRPDIFLCVSMYADRSMLCLDAFQALM